MRNLTRVGTRGPVRRCIAAVAPVLLSALLATGARADTIGSAGVVAQDAPLFELTIPFYYDNTPISSVDAKVSTDGRFEIAREDLLNVLERALSPEALADAEADLAGVDIVTPDVATQAGFTITFDQQLVALRLKTEADVRRETDVSLSEFYDNSFVFDRSPPYADFSAFLNLTTGVEIDVDGGEADVGALIGADGAIRFADFVLRGSTFYETVDNEFEVGSIQLIRDFIDFDVRATAGDIATIGSTLIGTEDLVGLSLSHRSGRFGRNRPLSSITAETFDLDRSATVEIYVNGQLRRRLRLAPGRFNLSDFGLVTGANEVRIVTIDDSGRRDEITLTTFSDANLLTPGDFRWEIAGGFLTEDDLVGFSFDLEDEDPIGSFALEYGLTDQISLGSSGIFREDGQAVSLTLDAATPLGLIGLDVAGSIADGETGGAANLVFSPYLPNLIALPGRSFSFSAFAATNDFSSVALPDADNEELSFAARFTEPFLILDTPVRTALFGSYQRFNNVDDDEQFQVGGSVGFVFGPEIGLSLTSLYERDADGENEFNILLSLRKRFGDTVATSASYTTEENRTLVGATYQNQLGGVGTVRASALVESSDDTDPAISGTVSYTGNRVALAGSHFQEIADTDDSGGIGSTTTLTASTALVFADGHIGISRPVSDSFAIVRQHPSLGFTEVVLQPGRDRLGDGMVSDDFGPLVANDVGSYTQTSLRVKVEDLPLGYDLGKGVFDLAGPLHAGYVLQIGSDRSASATGTLLNRDGNPLSYAAGRVTSPDDAGFEEQKIFTNKAGRFVVQGLVPGKTYAIRLPGVPEQNRFKSADGTYGLNQLGELKTAAR